MAYRTALASLLVAGCGASKPPPSTGQVPPPKVVHLALEQVADAEAEPPTTRVSLILTDETGAARRELIGAFAGSCTELDPRQSGEPQEPILSLDCWHAGAGVKLRFILRDNVLNVLRADIDEVRGQTGVEAIEAVELPAGAAVRTDYTGR